MKRMLNLNALLLTLIVSATPAMVASESTPVVETVVTQAAKPGMFANCWSKVSGKASDMYAGMTKENAKAVPGKVWSFAKATPGAVWTFTKNAPSNGLSLVKEHPYISGALATALFYAGYEAYQWNHARKTLNKSLKAADDAVAKNKATAKAVAEKIAADKVAAEAKAKADALKKLAATTVTTTEVVKSGTQEVQAPVASAPAMDFNTALAIYHQGRNGEIARNSAEFQAACDVVATRMAVKRK